MFVNFNILNQLGSPAINSNTFANRPAAGQTGRLFVSTDTFEIYRDNGTGWDLIGGPGSSTVTGSGATGQVTYWTGTNTVSGENALFWDAAQNHLGINTATPTVALDVHSAADVALQLNGTGATPSIFQQFLSAGVSQYQVGYNWNASADYRRFSIYDSVGAKETITIDQQSRYVGINYQYSTLTDQPAYTLDVSGSGRFTDNALFNTVGGSSLFGTTTDFTTITQGGTIKINGFGIYPFTNNDLTTNTTEYTTAILQNSTAFSGTNGASGQAFTCNFLAPLLSNNSTGGSNANTVTGLWTQPTFSATSGTAPNNINGIVSNCYRITSTDTSTGNGNVVGMRVNVRTAPPVPSTINNSNLGSILATAVHNSGTSSQVYNLRSQLTVGSSGANTSTVSSYMGHLRCDAYNVGATSGNTATVPTGFGIWLNGPTVNATGTLTTYYSLYQGAATVSGTFTNRWGIYIDDSNFKNYFAGNTLIGTTTDAGQKFQVNGSSAINGQLLVNKTTASSTWKIETNGKTLSNGNTCIAGSIIIASGATQTIYTIPGTSDASGLYHVFVGAPAGSQIYTASGTVTASAWNNEAVFTSIYDGANVTLQVTGMNIEIVNNGFATITWNYTIHFIPITAG
jgi:hypothetical protein